MRAVDKVATTSDTDTTMKVDRILTSDSSVTKALMVIRNLSSSRQAAVCSDNKMRGFCNSIKNSSTRSTMTPSTKSTTNSSNGLGSRFLGRKSVSMRVSRRSHRFKSPSPPKTPVPDEKPPSLRLFHDKGSIGADLKKSHNSLFQSRPAPRSFSPIKKTSSMPETNKSHSTGSLVPPQPEYSSDVTPSAPSTSRTTKDLVVRFENCESAAVARDRSYSEDYGHLVQTFPPPPRQVQKTGATTPHVVPMGNSTQVVTDKVQSISLGDGALAGTTKKSLPFLTAALPSGTNKQQLPSLKQRRCSMPSVLSCPPDDANEMCQTRTQTRTVRTGNKQTLPKQRRQTLGSQRSPLSCAHCTYGDPITKKDKNVPASHSQEEPSPDQPLQLPTSSRTPLNSCLGTNNNTPVSSTIVPFTARCNETQANGINYQSSQIPVAVVNTTMSARNPTNQPQFQPQRPAKAKVSSMDYTDPYGDVGLYNGQVDDDSRPHGKGNMKYDNGIFYEGNWIHGYKDERKGDAPDAVACNMTRNRILGGFTSWKGAVKKGNGACGKRGTFVYGMDWADLRGTSGKYTGHVDTDENPDGEGVMRYDFGLIAEGKWIKGQLVNAFDPEA